MIELDPFKQIDAEKLLTCLEKQDVETKSHLEEKGERVGKVGMKEKPLATFPDLHRIFTKHYTMLNSYKIDKLKKIPGANESKSKKDIIYSILVVSLKKVSILYERLSTEEAKRMVDAILKIIAKKDFPYYMEEFLIFYTKRLFVIHLIQT